MFQIGDLIIYGSVGVCKVEDIGVPDIYGMDADRQYYTLAPLYKQGKVYTPVDTKVFMRPVISRSEALELIKSIPDIDDDIIENRNIRVLSEKYQSTMDTHECSDLMHILKSIRHKRNVMDERGKKLGQVDEKFYRKAEDLLHGEFAVALDIPKEKVGAYIADKVKGLGESAS